MFSTHAIREALDRWTITSHLFPCAKRFLRFSGYHDSQKTNLLDHECTIFPQLTNLCTKVTKVDYIHISSHHIIYRISMFFAPKQFLFTSLTTWQLSWLFSFNKITSRARKGPTLGPSWLPHSGSALGIARPSSDPCWTKHFHRTACQPRRNSARSCRRAACCLGTPRGRRRRWQRWRSHGEGHLSRRRRLRRRVPTRRQARLHLVGAVDGLVELRAHLQLCLEAVPLLLFGLGHGRVHELLVQSAAANQTSHGQSPVGSAGRSPWCVPPHPDFQYMSEANDHLPPPPHTSRHSPYSPVPWAAPWSPGSTCAMSWFRPNIRNRAGTTWGL